MEMVKTRQIDMRFVYPALGLPCVLFFFERFSVRTSHGECDSCQSDFSNLCLEIVLHFEFLSSSHLLNIGTVVSSYGVFQSPLAVCLETDIHQQYGIWSHHDLEGSTRENLLLA